MMMSQVFFCVLLCLAEVSTTVARPNVIIMQPDDFEFLTNWNPPAHFPNNNGYSMRNSLLPNLTLLRNRGLHMERAYTASPVCGPSRYSTLTGRYPSRSAYARSQLSATTDSIATVSNPSSKLIDVGDDLDCSRNNLPALMKANGYRTGFMGKWHVGPQAGRRNGGPTTYAEQQSSIQQCGFDATEAIYWENLTSGSNGEYLHNLEHMTAEAIDFIDAAVQADEDFFLYFNPTAPHSSGSVLESLTEYTCLDSSEGTLAEEPVIPGMTEGVGCAAYRQTILDRADGDMSNEKLGNIWVDDTVGALVQKLTDVGQLDNTLFVFQIDHGQEGKGTLYEPGLRIAQFVHYPDAIPRASTYSGLVSTIDLGPTVADFAGIDASSPGWYEMDGESWKSNVEVGRAVGDRCLVAELDEDRSAVCTCEKIVEINDADSNTLRKAGRLGLAGAGDFQLCDAQGAYLTSPDLSPETATAPASAAFDRPSAVLECHKAATDPFGSQQYGLCDHLMFPVGSTSAPTTASPTSSPAVAETMAPTTAASTETPTEAATDSPTLTPTTIPGTNSPTVLPTTVASTRSPTAVPTVAATSAPTVAVTTSAPITSASTTAPVAVATASPTMAATTVAPTDGADDALLQLELIDVTNPSQRTMLYEGIMIPLGSYTVEAVPLSSAANKVKSVQFALDTNPSFRTENVAPYVLCGDSSGTTYFSCGSQFASSTHSGTRHTLTATAFAQYGAYGSPIGTVRLSVTMQ